MFYCDQVYMPANAAFDKEVAAEGYPQSLHGGLTDTSIMMYLDKDGSYVPQEQAVRGSGHSRRSRMASRKPLPIRS